MYELQPNTTLQNGAYKILKTIGQGGFGITYLAEMTEMREENGEFVAHKSQVAIKEFFIKDEHFRNSDGTTVCCTDNVQKKTDIERWKKKFKRETEILKSVDDNQVVKVIEQFEENSTAYYSMEYIDGCNLYDYVPTGGLKESDSLALIKKVALALKVLHDKKLLHSDLNPKNIMRNTNGNIVLIDFGLSKLYDENQNPINSSVSIPAAFPGYAPIEQADFDGKFAPTLDMYALGANLYKMLTGENPVNASKLLYDFSAIRNKLLDKNVSKRTIDIVEKAMQPIKGNRFQNVDDFLNTIGDDTIILPPYKITIPPHRLNANILPPPHRSKIFAHPFSFNGRIRRLEFNLSLLIYFICKLSNIVFVYQGAATIPNERMIVFYVLSILICWFLIAQSAKRCHDLGHNGWWQLIPLYFLWLIFQDSQNERNEYGEYPK